MRLPFCILNVLGDVLDGGELQFVEAARTLKAARSRVEALAKSCPGQYVIYNGQTGNNYPFHAEHNQDHLMGSVFRDRLAIQLEK
jgi:hypothetical protein